MKALTGLLLALGLLALALVVVFYVPAWAGEYEDCMKRVHEYHNSNNHNEAICTTMIGDCLKLRYPHPEPYGRIPMSPGDLMMPPRVFTDIQTTRERLIREWTASGEICRVLGRHFWIHIPHTTLEYRSDGAYPKHRKCELCDKYETKEEVWK